MGKKKTSAPQLPQPSTIDIRNWTLHLAHNSFGEPAEKVLARADAYESYILNGLSTSADAPDSAPVEEPLQDWERELLKPTEPDSVIWNAAIDAVLALKGENGLVDDDAVNVRSAFRRISSLRK